MACLTAWLTSRLTASVERLWYSRAQPPRALLPFSALFGWLARRRRTRLLLPGNHYRSLLPVIVIGNLTVGGTGKSPLAAWLVAQLQSRGYQPVILTRGYFGNAAQGKGGNAAQGEPSAFPLLVTAATAAELCGDEPLMLARQCRVPVVVDPDRARAADWAATEGLGNILVCDDGLQHYRLSRNLELVVFDGQRGAGNGALLPAGPLREPLDRLSSATAVIVNGPPAHETFSRIRHQAPAFFTMTLKPQALRQLNSGEKRDVGQLRGQTVHGVAGIGNPERFFMTLEALGCQVIRHTFPDHHPFKATDLPDDDTTVVMTAKDSVKCEGFARDNWWVLDVTAEPEPALAELIFAELARKA